MESWTQPAWSLWMADLAAFGCEENIRVHNNMREKQIIL